MLLLVVLPIPLNKLKGINKTKAENLRWYNCVTGVQFESESCGECRT